MKRLPRRWLLDTCAVATIAAGVVGCASWHHGNESIVHVDSKQNPSLARRLTLVGVKEMGLGNIDKATEKFIAAINADEAYGPAHNNLGLLHFEQGNLYQAVLAFEQAMEFMPTDPIVYYNLALTLESAGRVSAAMELYMQAVQMAPTNPVFLGNLVRLRIRLGESGPDLNEQLQDLVLIETRPDWRRWADRQLALFFNDALDRGPETPEFNPNGDDDSSEKVEFRIEDRVIDLTPKPRPETVGNGSPRSLAPPQNNGSSSGSRRSEPESVPLAIPDPSSFESMPRSIDSLPPPPLPDLNFR